MILIKNACLYAPEKLGYKDILIGGGEILAVSDHLELTLPSPEVIDAEGEMVHPGLIDVHVHAIGGGGEAGMLSRVPPLSEKKIADAGVTSLVGVLGTDGYTRTVRDLVSKIKGYREWGLSAWALTGSYQIPSLTLTGSVGDDIAFVEEIIGVKVAISDHRCSFPTTEELIRLASEVRLSSLVAGKAGIVHFHVGASPLGISQLFEIRERTGMPVRHLFPTHMGGHMDQAEKWLAIGGNVDITCHGDADEKAALLLERYPDKVTMSTDSNGSFPKWNDDKSAIIGMGAGSIMELKVYLDKLLKSGLDKTIAIKAVTSNAASAMQLKKKGCIAEGMDADLVIRNGSGIRYVIANGSVLVREGVAKESMYEGV
ncbi:MAG: amidohydrolase family protein [Bullifex sp.]